jgi:Flp pilus assembly protein CpaB
MSKILSPAILGIGILAILAGLAGAYVVRSALHREAPRREAPRLQTVPLATVDLPEGRRLTMGDVGLHSMTFAEIKEKNLDLNLTMTDPEQIIGRTLKSPIKQGQPFLSTSLFLEGTRPSFMDRLKPGMRTYTLLLAKERLGGLGAGARVDVLFRSTATNPSANSEALPIPELTVTLMRGVEILDVYEAPPASASGAGRRFTNANPNLRTLELDSRSGTPAPLPQITLAVTPEQAVKLQAVQGRGDISLIGWPKEGEGDGDGAAQIPAQLSLRDILALRPPLAPDDFVTEIYKKTSRSVNYFRNGKLAMQDTSYGGNAPVAPAAGYRQGPPPPAPGIENGGLSPRSQLPDRASGPDPSRRGDPRTTAVAGAGAAQSPTPPTQ